MEPFLLLEKGKANSGAELFSGSPAESLASRDLTTNLKIGYLLVPLVQVTKMRFFIVENALCFSSQNPK